MSTETPEGAAQQRPVRQTLKVHLSDAATDVLVWLAEQEPHTNWWTPSWVVAQVTPDDCQPDAAWNCLRMLIEIGYVDFSRSDGFQMVRITASGRAAVDEARAAALRDQA